MIQSHHSSSVTPPPGLFVNSFVQKIFNIFSVPKIINIFSVPKIKRPKKIIQLNYI